MSVKRPLRIEPGHRLGTIRVVDSYHRVIAVMSEGDLDIAQRMLRTENGLIHTIFGDRRDERQAAYDEWVGTRNRGA